MKLQIFEVISVVVLKCHVVRILFPGKPNVHIRSVYFDHDDGRILPRKKILVYSTTGLIHSLAQATKFYTAGSSE